MGLVAYLPQTNGRLHPEILGWLDVPEEEKGPKDRPGMIAADPEFPCNESFSPQAGFGAWLCFHISPMSFFLSKLMLKRLTEYKRQFLWPLPSYCSLV